MRNPRKFPVRSRYPGYDVLAKRHTPSWNEQTRRVISTQRWRVGLNRVSSPTEEFANRRRRLPPASCRSRHAPPPIPVAALVDDKLARGASDGYRSAGMPRDGDAWRLGLQALDAEAQRAYGGRFHELAED